MTDRAREMASLWIEFADNGNIRFWTRDPNTAVVQWGAKAGDYAYAPTTALQSLMDRSLDKSGVAIIEGDNIVIRIAIEALPMAYDNSPLAARNQEADALYKVTDPPRFAKGVCLYLNDEEEDGTTPIHRMLDAAMEAALENGEEGIEEVAAIRALPAATGEKNG